MKARFIELDLLSKRCNSIQKQAFALVELSINTSTNFTVNFNIKQL